MPDAGCSGGDALGQPLDPLSQLRRPDFAKLDVAQILAEPLVGKGQQTHGIRRRTKQGAGNRLPEKLFAHAQAPGAKNRRQRRNPSGSEKPSMPSDSI